MAEVYYTVNRSLILLIFIGFDFHGWRSKGEIRGRARRAKKVAAGAGSHSNFQICFFTVPNFSSVHFQSTTGLVSF